MDSIIQDFKPNWSHIRKFVVQEGDGVFASQMLQDYGREIQYVRRSFESLRPQELQIVRVWKTVMIWILIEFGDDCGSKQQENSTQRIYQRRKRQSRDIRCFIFARHVIFYK